MISEREISSLLEYFSQRAKVYSRQTSKTMKEEQKRVLIFLFLTLLAHILFFDMLMIQLRETRHGILFNIGTSYGLQVRQ